MNRTLTIHHAGNSFGRQHGFAEIEKMHTDRYPASELGFHTFYNFVIEPDGLIILCREYNEDEVHVCVVGGGDYREFSKESIISLKYLIRVLDPSKIQYHKDYEDKSCPGKLFPYNEITL